MSHDLAFFPHRPNLSGKEVSQLYVDCCEGRVGGSPETDPTLSAFAAALEARYPQLSNVPEQELESSPWSSDFDLGPGHLIISMAFSRAQEVGGYVWELLQQHPLVIYDPQADQAFFGMDQLPQEHRPVRKWRQFWK